MERLERLDSTEGSEADSRGYFRSKWQKAASFLGRNSTTKVDIEQDGSQKVHTPPLQNEGHRMRSNSESASRITSIMPARGTASKGISGKTSLTSLAGKDTPSLSPLAKSERNRPASSPASCEEIYGSDSGSKGEVFCTSSQHNTGDEDDICIPHTRSMHRGQSRSLCMEIPVALQELPNEQLSAGSASATTSTTSASVGTAPAAAATGGGSSSVTTSRRSSAASANVELPLRQSAGPTVSTSSAVSVDSPASTPISEQEDKADLARASGKFIRNSLGSETSVSIPPLEEGIETTTSAPSSPKSDKFTDRPGPDRSQQPSGKSKPFVRSTKSVGYSLDEDNTQQKSRDVRKVKLTSRPTAPAETGSNIRDEKSQVLLERINTLTRRNRIMSMRRRGCSDTTVNAILTAESVGTMDFTRMAIAGFADGEKTYRNTLRTVYFNYCKPLQALANTSQPICSAHEVETIFLNMEDLYSLHNAITLSLEPLVNSDFQRLTTLPDTFKVLLPRLGLYKTYRNNFHTAIETVGRLRVESPAFQSFLDNASQIKIKGRRVEPLEEMLRAPMVRLDNYCSLLSDLCSSDLMPEAEDNSSSYDIGELKSLLAQLTNYIQTMQDPGKVQGKQKWERKLVKSAVCVELHESKRKFRHVCLFNDAILCATRARTKNKSSSQCPHDCKWFLPLEELTWHPLQDVSMDPIIPVTPTTAAEISQCHSKINKLKGELKHSEAGKKKFGLKHDRERKRKNLQDLEVSYKIMQHNQVLRLFSRTGKVRTLLFVEQAEMGDWTTTIENCQAGLSQRPTSVASISTVDINHMLFLAKSSLQKHEEEVKAFVEDDDVELLDGLLVVLVDCAYGLKSKGKTEVFSQLEVDTYGRLERKAKTKCVQYSIKPEWDQGFEVELEAAHSLTVQIYESRMLTDNGIAKGMIDLVNSGLLDQEIHTIDLPLQPQGQLSMKLQYLTPEMMLKRSEMMKANTTTAVFGVPLEFVTMRESTLVPNIVRLCAQEVELRGLEETGVYRISGLASEVKMLREAFDTDIDQAAKLVKEVDIHAVTGALKLFLREMPEPMFPRILYSRFVEGSNLSNSDSRVSCMVSLLYSMPDTNLLTTLYLIKHLKNVSEYASMNKMTTSNLATVIGPNVLKPIDDGADRIVLDIGNQVTVLGFFLDLQLDLLEPEERDVDGQSVQEVLSSTSVTRLAHTVVPSRSTDSLGIHHVASGRESPQSGSIHHGYLDIHNKTS
ncbi:active breakpoint cluster region-related protein-like isoform X2 [Sycon ciliatum]|uniref:active breakpoint cluster region-related protein-like isoform X2 n=1 Tax=Sycon ciliatum TaxID=27933 RepID=UPI0031F668E5